MRILVFAGAACTILGAAHAERLMCPPEDGLPTLSKDKWERQYWGWLKEVHLVRSFSGTDGKVSVTVTCIRAGGSSTISLAKTCRLISGKGTVEQIDNSKYSEGQLCKIPDIFLGRVYYNNDDSCIVECN
jgi:hypothetical protein